jgi:hypothetical protein
MSFEKPRIKQKSATELASRLAARPQVLAMMRDLYREAKKSTILSHGEWLAMMIDAFHQSMAEGNKTAAASFGRLMGQGIGSLNEVFRIEDQRMSNEQLLDRLAGQDTELAAMLRNRLQARDSFDA